MAVQILKQPVRIRAAACARALTRRFVGPRRSADALRLRGGWPGFHGKPAAPAAPAPNAKGNSAAGGGKKAAAAAAGKTAAGGKKANSPVSGKAAVAPAGPSGVEEEKRKYLRVRESLKSECVSERVSQGEGERERESLRVIAGSGGKRAGSTDPRWPAFLGRWGR